jgi:hypothetical protein
MDGSGNNITLIHQKGPSAESHGGRFPNVIVFEIDDLVAGPQKFHESVRSWCGQE